MDLSLSLEERNQRIAHLPKLQGESTERMKRSMHAPPPLPSLRERADCAAHTRQNAHPWQTQTTLLST